MPTVILRHKVGDFDTWLKGHQDRVDLFSKFGPGFKTFRDVDDPNSIVIVAEVDDLEGMQATLADPGVMQDVAVNKHKVILPVIVSMPVAV